MNQVIFGKMINAGKHAIYFLADLSIEVSLEPTDRWTKLMLKSRLRYAKVLLVTFYIWT